MRSPTAIRRARTAGGNREWRMGIRETRSQQSRTQVWSETHTIGARERARSDCLLPTPDSWSPSISVRGNWHVVTHRPQAFEPVELADARQHHVHDDIAEVDQHPF